MNTKAMPLWKNFVLHIIPGVVVTALYLLVSSIVVSPSIPKALIFDLSRIILIPTFIIIMKLGSPSGKLKDLNLYREKTEPWKMILFSLVSFLWAGLIMMLFNPISSFIQSNYFGWMSDKFDVVGHLTNPQMYSKNMLILTWLVGLLLPSIVIPVFEEYYFRGYLLKELENHKRTGILLSGSL